MSRFTAHARRPFVLVECMNRIRYHNYQNFAPGVLRNGKRSKKKKENVKVEEDEGGCARVIGEMNVLYDINYTYCFNILNQTFVILMNCLMCFNKFFRFIFGNTPAEM